MDLDQKEMQKRLVWYEKKYGPYIERRGIHNWNHLFRRPTLLEWTILAMLVMSLFIAWAYQADTKMCRETIENLPDIACSYCQSMTHTSESNYSGLNFSLNIIKEESEMK